MIKNKTFIILMVLFVLWGIGSETPSTSVDSGGTSDSNVSATQTTMTRSEVKQSPSSVTGSESAEQNGKVAARTTKNEPVADISSPTERSSLEQQISKIDFFTIRHNMQQMTELQFKEYCKSLSGSRIQWRGYVDEIKEAWTGGYKISIDMDSPQDPLSSYDIDAFKISKEVALSLNKDEIVTFTGTIDNVLTILGTSIVVSLEDAELL